MAFDDLGLYTAISMIFSAKPVDVLPTDALMVTDCDSPDLVTLIQEQIVQEHEDGNSACEH